MSRANPRWGAPRIHGDSRKIGIAVAQSTVAKEQLDYNLLFRWFVGLVWRISSSDSDVFFVSIAGRAA
jgi:hypothetical protein